MLLQNGSNRTRLYENTELQRLAARDFLRLGGASEHFEWAYYYLYEGPSQVTLSEPHHEHDFDSALLHGEGVHENQEPREAYCVLALGNSAGCPAKVTTRAAVAGVTASSTSTVLLDVYPEGLPTKYLVEYGTSTAYGYTTTSTEVVNNVGGQSEDVSLSGLEPCTTYHYQAEAENEANDDTPGLGGDRTFTTVCWREPTTSIAAGWHHTCALLSSGGIKCWGDNKDGQLGNGTTTNSSTPVSVSGITNATTVTAGLNYSCSALVDGAVKCWGNDKKGQLGDGGSKSQTTPVSVSGLTNVLGVTAVGEFHACALELEEVVSCWGANESGQAPALVEGLGGTAVSVGGGSGFTCVLLASGHIECFGDNFFGELGDGTTTESATPVSVSGISNATTLSAGGGGSACASLSNGEIKCWGANEMGELGNGTTTNSTTPVSVSGITSAAEVSAGERFACALIIEGSVECWGDNEQGQLGDGSTASSTTPVSVSGISDAIALAASGSHACVRLADDSVRCWGANEFGQIGDGTTVGSTTPVAVSGLP